MALSDPKQQLELIAAKTERAVDMGPRILREIKSSILFQYNWEELLMSGPVSISCLGACFVAAASPKANVIFSPPSTGRFAALIDLDGEYGLKANLVECANLGNSAFIVAEDGMNVINMTSENVYNIVDDIMITLESPQDAKILLPQQLATLGESATTCYEAARKIDLKFEKWLDHVRELHVACIATQTSTSDKLIANDIERATTQISIDYQKVTVAQLEKTTKKLEEQLDVTTEAYKKASDGFPTGWDLLGQQIVGQLADSLTTALNQAIPALVDNLNPIAKAKAVAGLASGLIHGNEKEKANEAPSTNGNADAPAADRHISSPAATRPKDADDPAYNQAARDLPFFELVNGTFIGDDGGIDWDKAKGEPGKANQSIVFAAKMLQSSKTAFESLATSAEPSKTYSGALATACEIANGIKGELDKAKDIKYTLPSKESTTVQKWQSDFTSAFVALTGLISRAKSFPGSPAGGAGIASGVDPAVQTAQINAKTAQSQMLLDAGKNRLTTTQAALVATQETYQKSTELLTQQQNRFAELNANLERLKSTDMKLSEIKAVLVQCIMLVVNLKTQITNLVRFFKAIATTVEFVLNKQVKPFITTIKAITSDGVDPNEEFKVGQYTMTDLQRSAIFNSTLTIRAYYSVFGDIAQMWMDMSQSNIFPGLRMLDELSALDVEKDKAAMQKKAAELQRWSQKASDDVFAAAKKKQDKVLGGMKSRVATIANTTHYLPPPPKKVQQAIENGVEHSKLAAEKGIERQVEGSLVGKFSGKRLPRGDDD